MKLPDYNPKLTPELNLLNALIFLKETTEERKNCGICPHITLWAARIDCNSDRRQVENKLDSLVKSWPKAHGINFGNFGGNWPVGGHDEYCYERLTKEIWKNPRRLELLDYLIDQLSVNQ